MVGSLIIDFSTVGPLTKFNADLEDGKFGTIAAELQGLFLTLGQRYQYRELWYGCKEENTRSSEAFLATTDAGC
jgi:hypothetical protein